jgi:hypothetical protein
MGGETVMNLKRTGIADLLAAYCILFLLLIALGHLFVFTINWEDWFFGTKLDGWPAGLFLFAKAAGAAALALLLILDTKRRAAWGLASVFFFAFVFILPVFSGQRNMRSEPGWTIFWIECVLFLVIPGVLLAIYAIAGRDMPDGDTGS